MQTSFIDSRTTILHICGFTFLELFGKLKYIDGDKTSLLQRSWKFSPSFDTSLELSKLEIVELNLSMPLNYTDATFVACLVNTPCVVMLLMSIV